MKKRNLLISVCFFILVIEIILIIYITHSSKNIEPLDVSTYDETNQNILLDAMNNYCKINNSIQNKKQIANILSLTDLQYMGERDISVDSLLSRVSLLSKLYNMDLAVSSGDMNCSIYSKEISLSNLQYITSRIKEIDIPVLFTLGNHDRFIYGKPEQDISKEEYYNVVFSDFDASYKFNDSQPYTSYYYKDIDDKKLRVCVLNSFSSGNYEYVIDNEQLKFVASDMLNFEGKRNPNDWTVVFFIHTILPTEVHQEYVQGSDELFKILSAYKSGNKITSIENNEFDFSNKDRANIAAIFTGHHHLDYSFKHDDILVIGLSAVYSSYDRSDINLYDVVSDYFSDIRFEIISIDTKNKTIYTTRVGNGENRFWKY